MLNELPIDGVIPLILKTLAQKNNLTLVAPPGAGKTTKLPLELLNTPWAQQGKLILLEPRRLAARAAASRMAQQLGENLGGTIGLKIRFGAKLSPATRLEVMTEGVFTRLIIENPALEGYAGVIFDEFHERSLDCDFGLALALDCQSGLREDLKLIVMSATLDGARVSALIGGETIISEGRSFPVEMKYLGREAKLEQVILKALREETGSILVFLPGLGEISRLERALNALISDKTIHIHPLYGAMELKQQEAAIAPCLPNTRKIVLATSLAETSLTIEGVRVVVDSGLSRVPKYEAELGITRLETVRASRATITQRAGRAGRTQTGVCYRLWDEAQDLALPAFATPEIKDADLTQFLLDCAAWGAAPSTLSFIDAPPQAALRAAQQTLLKLESLDETGRITPQGKAIRALPLPPRLSHMVKKSNSRTAAYLALLLSERGLGGNEVNLETRLAQFLGEKSERAQEAKRMAASWCNAQGEENLGLLLSYAYPERVAKSRGKNGEFVLANGRGAAVEAHHALAREEFIVVADLTGIAAQARITAAAPLDASFMKARAVAETQTYFCTQALRLKTHKITRFGDLILSETPLALALDAKAKAEFFEAVQGMKLPFTPAQASLKTRAGLNDEAFFESLKDFIADKSAFSDITPQLLQEVLDATIDYTTKQRIEKTYPSHFEAPTGNRFLINYESEEPTISLRVTELYGVTTHPCIGEKATPLVIELLSPAYRPVQITRDLPSFWKGSYKDVRVDMKARYPRHSWPEDPMLALPTARAKPRGT